MEEKTVPKSVSCMQDGLENGEGNYWVNRLF